MPVNPTNSSPSWPASYPTSDDYSALNEGQLKNMATQAYNELQYRLPSSIWLTPQGQALTSLITVWNPSSGDAYAVVNLGQLKTVAKPFYDVLAQAGYPNSTYPWTGIGADDYSAANIGQAKHLFSFDLSLSGPSNLSATNGSSGTATLYWTLPTTNYATNLIVEEQASNGTWSVLQTLTNPATTSYAVTNLVEGQNYSFQIVGGGTNTFSVPVDVAEAYHSSYYGGVLPTLTYISGNNQTVAASTFLANPLVIKVTNSSGTPLVSAPVTFSLAPGADGGLSATNGGTTNSSVSVLTGSNGYATNYYEAGPDGVANNVIVASAYAGSGSTNYNFTAYCGVQSGLSAWYRADNGVTTSSGSVTNWSDQSTNGYNLTNAVGTNAPTPGTDPTTGKPVVQFNGSQTISRSSGLSGATNVTILTVASTPTPSASQALVDVGTSSTSSPTKGLVYAGGNQSFVSGWSSGTPAINTGGQAVQSGALTMNTVSYSSTNSLASFYSNGVANGTATASSGAITSGISLGSLTNYTNWNGNIAEAIIYNRVLTTTERQQVELYLANKYSIPPAISSPTTATGTVGVSFSYTITASNGPTSYSVISGTLPSGLTISSGVISGTPTAAGTSNVVISATSTAGSGTAILTLTINPASTPVINSSTVASGVVGQSIQFAVTASNGPTSYSITSGTLPSPLTLNTTTGLITGTPTATGTSTITVRATNAYGNSTTQNLTVIIGAAAPTISGLTAWFNANTGVTTSNGKVTQWTDQSSNTNNVYSSFPYSYSPIVTTDPASGNSVLNFNGNQLLTTSSAVTGGGNSVTIISVAGTSVPGSGQQTQVVVGGLYGGSNSARMLAFDNGNQSFNNNSGFFDGGPALVNSTLSINTVTFNSTSPGTATFYSQGVANGSASPISSATLSSGLTIGSISSTPYQSWNGNIAEVLIYNGVLTTTQRQSVEQYLANKYGLYAPNAAWIGGYSSTIQGEINRNQLNKAQADAYIALQANNPSMLTTGLKLWLRADAGVTVGIGTNVKGWADQTGNYPLTQNVAVDQPTLVTNDCNGEPAIRFSNYNNGNVGAEVLTNSASMGAGINADMTIIAVGVTTVPGASPQYSVYLGNGTNTGVSRALGYNNSLQYFNATGSTNTGTATPPAQTFVADGASLNTNSPPAVTFYRNGTSISGSPSNLSSVQSVNSGISVGSLWQGDICEALVYDHQLTSTELNEVSLYLANKYGLYYSGASWITNFTSSVQTQINANQWNEAQANTYVQVSGTLPVVNGLTGWFKADSGVQTSGSTNVTGWADSSWNHADVSQSAVTNQPTLGTDPGTGKPTVQFNGTTQYLANGNTYPSVNDASIIVMASTPSPTTLNYATLMAYGNGNTNAFGYVRGLVYNGGHQCYWNGSFAFSNGGPVANTAALTSSALTYSSSAQQVTFYSNGASNGTLSSVSTEPFTQGIAIGSGNFLGNSEDWTGNISEVLIYNRALSSTEITSLQTYLTNKYVSYSATATISVSGTNASTPRTVTLGGATSPAIIYYTLNGTTPTSSSTQYTAPFNLTTDTTVNCAIFNSGVQISPMATDQVWVGDTYGIGISDAWQTEYFGSVTNLNPNALTPGGSGLTYLQAYQWGYNPTVYSSNGDGLSDLLNHQLGYAATDTDINGYVGSNGVPLTNAQQLALGLDPFDIGVNPLPSAPLTDPGDTNAPTITLTQPLNAHYP
jgi:hypothetical protein